MKSKIILLMCLTAVIVFAMTYNLSWAKTESKGSGNLQKIGIVSIRKIFEKSEKNAEYQKRAEAEQDKILGELKKIDAEIKAAQAGLSTLVPGSVEYMAQVKEVLEKEGQIQAQKKFYEQQLSLKDQQWTEKLYQDILRVIAEVAKEKELGLVLEKDELEVPSLSVQQLMTSIRTNKILYSGGCVDISDEVISQLDG